jgi:hypothetical protein
MRSLVFGMTASTIMCVTALSYAQPAQTTTAQAAAPTPEPDMVTTTAPNSMDKTISALGAIGYGYGFGAAFGVGARYEWVILPKGFLRKLPKTMHDEFGIEPGFDYLHAGYSLGGGYSVDYNEFTPLVGVVWNIWLSDKVAVYPKVDIGYRIFSASESLNGARVASFQTDYFPVYFQGAAGVVYRIGNVSLRAEIGWEALRAGVALTL